MRALDYDLPCTELYRKECDDFLEWLSCYVQNWSSWSEIESGVCQYIGMLPISDVWIMLTGMHALSIGKRHKLRSMSGWNILIQELPFLRSRYWSEIQRYRLGRKLLRQGLELFGHAVPHKKKWRPPLLRAAFLSTQGG